MTKPEHKSGYDFGHNLKRTLPQARAAMARQIAKCQQGAPSLVPGASTQDGENDPPHFNRDK